MNDPKDKLTDALLREHAKGNGARDEHIARIEAAIDADGGAPTANSAKQRWSMAVAAMIGLSFAGLAGVAIYQKSREADPIIASHEWSPRELRIVALGETLSAAREPGVLELALADEEVAVGSGAGVAKIEREGGPDALARDVDETVEARVDGVVTEVRDQKRKEDFAPAPSDKGMNRLAESAPAEEVFGTLAKRQSAEQRDSPESRGAEASADGGGGSSGRSAALSGSRRFADGEGGFGGAPREEPSQEAFRYPTPDEAPRCEVLPRPSGEFNRENYGQLVDQGWMSPVKNPLSTFSIDVDTASYTNLRRILREGGRVQADAVRIEEMINYFDYSYPQPEGDDPFAVQTDIMTCPWNKQHQLVRVGIQGKILPASQRPVSNLVFLVDVSGSMNAANKLPLLRKSLLILLEELDERDVVSIVVYAGAEGLALPPTKVDQAGRDKVRHALDSMQAGGSTNGGAGIKLAYKIAKENFIKDGVNRVILASDGDFNVGTTGQGELVELVKANAGSNVFLSVLGFGAGNLNDAMMEAISNDGNGNYYYIDSESEGRKVFLRDLTGTLVTIAKDVKIQVDFNPGRVQGYRLIGYANRRLKDEDFNNDRVDAGDIGAGHRVTALYEIVPHGVPAPAFEGVTPSKYRAPVEPEAKPVESKEWLNVRLRHKLPEGDTSRLQEFPLGGEPVDWSEAGDDFRFAAGVALFGMKLRSSSFINGAEWGLVEQLAKSGAGSDPHGYRKELIELVGLAKERE